MSQVRDSCLKVDDPHIPETPYVEVAETGKPNGTVIDITPPQQNLLPPPLQPNQEQEQIKMGKDRNVFISYPDNLTKKELALIRRRIDEIEFRLETESS